MDCTKEERKAIREWCKYQTANVRMLRRREITVNRYNYIRRILALWLSEIEKKYAEEMQGV